MFKIRRVESKRFYLKLEPSNNNSCLLFPVLFLLISLTVLLSTKINLFNKQKPLVVQSGSMEPTIGVGALIFPKAEEGIFSPTEITFPKYNIGDIIVFNRPDKNSLVSHRITEIYNNKDTIFYKTKGDANNTEDSILISENSIIGKVKFFLPYLGYAIGIIKLPYIYFALIAIPSMYVMYTEIFFLIAELGKNRNRKKYFRKEYAMSILFLFFISFYFTNQARAVFTSSAKNQNNIFAAAVSFPHIVINEVYVDGDKKKEWVELYNPTSSSINVSGWKIEDNTSTDTIPTVSPIPAGGYAVIVADPTDVTGIPSSAVRINIDNNIGNGLADDDDRLILRNASSVNIDSLSYGKDKTIFDLAKPGSHKSLARSPNGKDTDTAGDWNSNSTPSIGVAN